MRAQLPKTPCIYFAINSCGEVQYIGQSINPRKRWLRHHRYKKLSKMEGIRIAWLKVSCRDLLPEVEKALIDWFKPPLNRLVATTIRSKSDVSASVNFVLIKHIQ